MPTGARWRPNREAPDRALAPLPLSAVPGDLLDVVLLVLAAAFAVAGYRQGFIIGVMSFAGFAAGAIVGAYLAPNVVTLLAKSQHVQAVLAIAGVFAAAVIGMLAASALGVALRSKLHSGPTTVLDSLGGAAVNVVAIVLLAWLLGTLVAYAPPFPALASQVNNSIVLRGVDRLIPQGVQPDFTALRRLLATEPYAQVFGALGAETALSVPKPDPGITASPEVVADQPSVVKIEGVALSCKKTIEGSGFVIAKDRVVTNAHVVAGVDSGPIVYIGNESYPARVVLFDPKRDVAVLDVPGLNRPPLHFAFSAPFGGNAIVAGYPKDRSFTVMPARVGQAENASGPDIYNTTTVNRQIYPIRADVRSGNSGGPLIAPDGAVYGMVFAAAVSVPQTGYALTATEIKPDVLRGERLTSPVSTGRCQGS